MSRVQPTPLPPETDLLKPFPAPRFLRHLVIASMLGGANLAAAGEGDHDRARQAVEAGEVLPLHAILQRVARDYPGQAIEVELERDRGRWIYEIKLLRSGGALVKIKVDARDGSVIGVKGRAGGGQPERSRRAGEEH